MREVVWDLRNGRASGITVIRAENIKGWLQGVEWEEEEEEEGNAGAWDTWRTFVKLVHAI